MLHAISTKRFRKRYFFGNLGFSKSTLDRFYLFSLYLNLRQPTFSYKYDLTNTVTKNGIKKSIKNSFSIEAY